MTNVVTFKGKAAPRPKPTPADILIAIAKAELGDWFDPLDVPLNWSCELHSPDGHVYNGNAHTAAEAMALAWLHAWAPDALILTGTSRSARSLSKSRTVGDLSSGRRGGARSNDPCGLPSMKRSRRPRPQSTALGMRCPTSHPEMKSAASGRLFHAQSVAICRRFSRS
jgi:hypothetical protein